MTEQVKNSSDVPVCIYSRALELISNKWTPYILYELEKGSVRYGELKRRLEGISKKMLTQTLRQLERDGFVDRKITYTNPPMVHYSLTELGKTILSPLKSLRQWSLRHYATVEKARAVYDKKQSNHNKID